MNKGLHDQINGYMPEKINKLRESAQKRAEEDFNDYCEKIKTGDFEVIKEDQIEVKAINRKMSKNTIWRDAYSKTLSELFSEENLEVLKAYSYYSDLTPFSVVRLKI